jgi:hypothetical protein
MVPSPVVLKLDVQAVLDANLHLHITGACQVGSIGMCTEKSTERI